ncbi:hypothetical protein [Stenotrophomonas sp. AS1]|uniref:hypothetical protein n=1 Tax=Stenotrophomonas sp. AS1 TaxID=3029188 RepID=UPI003B7E35B8
MSEEGRYFIITRSEFTKELLPERYLGRFHLRQHAEYRAKAKAPDWGEMVSIRQESPREAFTYRSARVLVRTLRVTAGVLLGLLVYGFLLHGGTGVGDTPFSQLTLNVLIGAVFKGAFAVALIWLSWVIAFGSGPKDP